MRIAYIPVIALLAACNIPETKEGSVVNYNGETVTIRGAYSLNTPGPAKPTLAMIEQAKAICPNARYLSANPNSGDNYTFLYLFAC